MKSPFQIVRGQHISRRTVLRGMGATVALPFLDAMVPAGQPWAKTAAILDRTRLICLEIVHGSAGSTAWGASQNLWAPAAEGHEFDLSPSAMLPLEPYRDYLSIISNTDCRHGYSVGVSPRAEANASANASLKSSAPRRLR